MADTAAAPRTPEDAAQPTPADGSEVPTGSLANDNHASGASTAPSEPFVEPHYDEELIHKTVLVGDSGVGKTSFLVQFDQGKFISGSFSATVGISFMNKVVAVDDAKVKLQIWDTAGQERFRSVTHAYYRDAHALLLLYDITNRPSFENIRAWLTEIHEYAQQNVVIMLLGNKGDMTAERAVKKDEGERLAKRAQTPGGKAAKRCKISDPRLYQLGEEEKIYLLWLTKALRLSVRPKLETLYAHRCG
uniref:RAB26, member RAS oncogene family n=1 Tax=Eptatretus burgeri TaxID=7764 RepID=A0A8C4R9B1_EPTBU